MSRDLVADSNENLRRACCRIAEETETGSIRHFGPITAAVAGVSSPIFNQVFVFEEPPRAALSAAIAWIRERTVPCWVTVTEPVRESVDSVLASHDLAHSGTQPGMAITSLDAISAPDTDAEIVEVTDPPERADFSSVTSSVFDWPASTAEQVDRVAIRADEIRMFLGRMDGRPVATGLLIRHGDVAGVYSIAVIEAYRRRGLGEAMTRAILRAGRDDGCTVGVLQSSEMGYPLYERMGFDPVVTYHHYTSTSADGGTDEPTGRTTDR